MADLKRELKTIKKLLGDKRDKMSPERRPLNARYNVN